MKQGDRFSPVPWGMPAHSTHLRGAGTYDALTGQERLRAQVTLATAIPADVCRQIGLGYLDPASVDVLMHLRDQPRAGRSAPPTRR